MAQINRASLPADFLDHVDNSGLLLPQPEPHWCFAKVASAGRLAVSALNAGQQTSQQYGSIAGGGMSISPTLDELIRFSDMYPGLLNVRNEFGLTKGDTIKFQRPVFSTGGATKAARAKSTTVPTSSTGMGITTEETTLSVDIYQGPYSETSGGVKPYEIAEFDAKYRASKVSLASLVSLNLVRDHSYWLHYVIRNEFQSMTYTTLANPDYTDFTDFVAGGGQKWTAEMILRARKTLTDRNVQPFPNGRYIAYVPTGFNTDMLEDVDYREMSKVHQDGRNLLYGYIGSIQNVDLFECSTLRTYAAGTTPPGDKTGLIGANVAIATGFMCGPGAVGFGVAQNPHCRYHDDTDYGNVAKVIWQSAYAIDVLDVRNVQNMAVQTA
jgi:hypothetical protein